MKPAYATLLYRKIVLPAVFGGAIGLTLGGAGIYHVYKTLVEAQEKSGGGESALVYACDSISELEREVSPAARPFFLGAEFYLHKYVSTHYQQK